MRNNYLVLSARIFHENAVIFIKNVFLQEPMNIEA